MSSAWFPLNTSGDLRGRALRYLLVRLLADARRPMTVQELIALCRDEDVEFGGRPSKIISDALRWERRSGRVKHLRRGVYVIGRVPRSTLRWITKRTEQTRAWLAWSKAMRRLGPPSAAPQLMVTGNWVWDPSSWVPDWPCWPELILSEP